MGSKSVLLRILFVVLAAIAAAYALTIPLQGDHFLRTVLRGHYWRYYEIFLPTFALLVWIGLWLNRAAGSLVAKFAIAIGASYVAGLIGFFFLPARLPTSQLLSLRDLNWAFFVSPIVGLCWFYGMAVGIAYWGFCRKRLAPLEPSN
jgi:hypothetical protein